MSVDNETMDSAMKLIATVKQKEIDSRDKIMQVAISGIQAAMTELIAIGEDLSDAKKIDAPGLVKQIVDAIRSIKVEFPDITPSVRVEAPEVNISPKLDVSVSAGENHIHVSPSSPTVTVIEAEKCRQMKVDFEYRKGLIVGATITKV
jgi:hypothetical protein